MSQIVIDGSYNATIDGEFYSSDKIDTIIDTDGVVSFVRLIDGREFSA